MSPRTRSVKEFVFLWGGTLSLLAAVCCGSFQLGECGVEDMRLDALRLLRSSLPGTGICRARGAEGKRKVRTSMSTGVYEDGVAALHGWFDCERSFGSDTLKQGDDHRRECVMW
ncbi:hypothetical protein L1049_013701 [Liquidambar formosana]|uniref:Secreted protein n=1 Tax=Liquidambar formosana TaxID=63359 RepID=A0AAP0WX27_LIQFO